MFSKLWVEHPQRYLDLQSSGMPVLAIEYEDIKSAPDEALAKIFEFCGLPASSMDAGSIRCWKKNSQAGTGMSQDALKHKQSGPE